MWLCGTENRYEWAYKHQELIWHTAEWIGSAKKGDSTTAPEPLLSQWQQLHTDAFREQVRTVLADKDAIERQDPKLVAAVRALLKGFVISDLHFDISNPVDASVARDKGRGEYEQQRHVAVGRRIASLTWRERRKGLEQQILDQYDRENLIVCSTCGIERHRGEPSWWHCQYCSGKYVPAHSYEPLPPLGELLDELVRMAGLA